jgi:uncharacterized protein (TIGR02145 family)
MKSKKTRSIAITLIVCLLEFVTISCCKNDNPLIQIPLVATGETQDITDNTAVCGGYNLSDGGSAITKCGVCWDTDSTLLLIEKAHYIQDSYDTGSFKSSITNLSAETKYFVRAYASNKLGTGYGKIISFKTVSPYLNQINFNPDLEYGNMIDQDGNSYKTVTIGNQVWMAQNLKAITYSSGNSIILDNDYYWYDNNINSNRATYGALYSWKAVNSGSLCPVGWHVPSKDEWYTLTLSLDQYARDNGMEFHSEIGAGKLKETSVTHWKDPNSGATNTSGFTAVPGGLRGEYPRICDSLSFVAYYFTSTGGHKDPTGATPGINFQLIIRIDFDTESLNLSYKYGYVMYGSVRCLKN